MQKRKDNKGRVLQKGEIQRNDGRYMYRYTDEFGNRCTEYSWRLVESDPQPRDRNFDIPLREKKKLIDNAKSDFISFSAGKMTLNELFDLYIELRCKMKKITLGTYQNYKSIWDKHIRNTIVAELPITQLRKNGFLHLYQDLLDKGVGKGSITLMHKVISATLNYAVSEDYIRKNYAIGCNREFDLYLTKREALTIEQQNAFLRFVASHPQYKNLYWTFIFMIETACRASELAGLTLHDIDDKQEYISINHQLINAVYEKGSHKRKLCIRPPKTYSSMRTIPLSNQAKKALEMQKQLLHRNSKLKNYKIDSCKDFIFLTLQNHLWTAANLDSCLKRIVTAYNNENISANKTKHKFVPLPKITAHILRHTACTRMAESGMNTRILQAIMGHENFQITMKVYNHVDTQRLRNEMDRLDVIRETFM